MIRLAGLQKFTFKCVQLPIARNYSRWNKTKPQEEFSYLDSHDKNLRGGAKISPESYYKYECQWMFFLTPIGKLVSWSWFPS
jgi:hypothetical protein